MPINLPEPDLMRKSHLASWMLFPHDEMQRREFRKLIERKRVLISSRDADKPKKPAPYRAKLSDAGDVITLVPNVQGEDVTHPTDFLPDEETVNIFRRMFDEAETNGPTADHDFREAFKKGFIAGCVLLNCYIYNDHPNIQDRHSTSKKKGLFATQQLFKLKETATKNFFIEFEPVAHVWAAYLISAPDTFLTATEFGIARYAQAVQPDFLGRKNIDIILSNAKKLSIFGTQKKTVKNLTLLDLAKVYEFSKILPAENAIHIPEAITNLSLAQRTPGKLASRQ